MTKHAEWRGRAERVDEGSANETLVGRKILELAMYEREKFFFKRRFS